MSCSFEMGTAACLRHLKPIETLPQEPLKEHSINPQEVGVSPPKITDNGQDSETTAPLEVARRSKPLVRLHS